MPRVPLPGPFLLPSWRLRPPVPTPGPRHPSAGLRLTFAWGTWADEQRGAPQPHRAQGFGPTVASRRAAHSSLSPRGTFQDPPRVPGPHAGPSPVPAAAFYAEPTHFSMMSRMEAHSHCRYRQLSRQSFLFFRGFSPFHLKEGLCGLSLASPNCYHHSSCSLGLL